MTVIENVKDYFDREIEVAEGLILVNREIIVETERQIIYWDARKKAMQDVQAFVKNYGG